jgi:gliding motility-associated-like protein
MPAALLFPALPTTPIISLLTTKSGRLASVGNRCLARQAQPVAGWLFVLLLLLLSGLATTVRAQATSPPECSQDEKFINNWYFGYRAGLDFNQATDSIPPKVLTDGRMVAPAGSGVMSDGMGNLLFYSNGDTIWSRNHSIMPNGTGLGGNRLATDGPLAIKFPGSPATPGGPTRYLLFTQDAQGGPKGLSYSEISIPVGGQGEVVAATKNMPLTKGTAEKMTGVLHKNGCDVWIIVHGWGASTTGNENRGDSFLAYRVTPAGVQPTPVISTIGAVHAPGIGVQGYRGQMKVSPDGEQLAVARFSDTAVADSSSTVELFAFDAATGVVSNRRVIDSGAGRYYGVEFSPSRGQLYATVMSPPQLLQFDLSAANIPASKQDIPLKQTTPVNLGSMQAAPDGKIYVARENQLAVGFIAYPDSLGAKAAYADDSLQLDGRRGGLGLPNFNQSSLLRVGFGAQSTACLEITFQAGSPIPNPESYAWTFKTSAGAVLGTSAVADPKFTFPAPGDYQVTLRITNFCFCREVTSLIRVPGPPTPGSIGASQTVCAGSTPAPLTSTAPAGEGTGQFSYQWQSSADNSNWTDIAGATAPSYAPSTLAATTYFRRLVTSGFCAPRTPTASVAVTVLPALVAGSIAADQTVCAGSPVAPLTGIDPATGGSGTFAYQWEASLDNSNWTAIAGATGTTYSPGPLAATTYFRRQVSSGACPATPSNVVRVTVVPGLAAGIISASQRLCAGATPDPLTSDSVATGGTGPITYQWESSADNVTWTPIGGATGPTYAPGALAATTYFRRLASAGSACAPAISNVVTITVAPVLVAGTIGTAQTLCPGTTPAPLTSTAGASGGTDSFAYQWESSPDNSTWTVIAGATGVTFSPGLLTATTYFRRGVTSGACGPAYSPAVLLTVVPGLNAGAIAADQTICAGSTPAPLGSGGASGGTGTFAYQWEFSFNNSTWTAIAGATGETFAPGPLTATTYFRRQVSSGGCAPAFSNVVTITVAPALVAGVIGAGQALCAGGTASPLTSAAPASGGTGPLIYQWESSADNVTWADVPGATGDTFSPGSLAATTYFRRRVTSGSCGPSLSNAVVITVTPALTAGTIGADQTLCPGATPTPLTSAAGASGGTDSFAYQWESSLDNSTWTAIAGATGETFAPGPLTATTYYRRRVSSGPCGPGYSPTVTLTVVPTLVAGSIAADQDICAGTTPAPLTSGSGASGGIGTYTYQWESSTDNASWLAIPGATGATFAPGPLTATTYYRRRVTSGTGGCSTVVSNAVAIRVQPLVTPTVSLATPPVQCPGTALTFTAVVANAGSAPAFQWFVNNVAVASGPTFTSSTLATGDQVRVQVTPTAGLCSTGPATATVTVTRTLTPLPTLAIAVQPGGPVCLGEPLTFSIASVTGAGPAPAYQWQVNGSDVAGATNPVFTSTTLRDGQTVTLRLRTTNDCGQAVTVVSTGVAVRIQPPVVVSAGPDKEILAGTSVVLEGTADGTYPVTWTPALGLTISASNPLRPVAAPLVTTTYTLSAGAGGCASSDQVTVTVRPAIRIPNAFTPNGDGENDTWQIEFIEQFPDNTVTVFNRWGNRIFSAENYSRANEWRGDINGQPAPVGTYYYVVVTKGPLGKSYAGSITILY